MKEKGSGRGISGWPTARRRLEEGAIGLLGGFFLFLIGRLGFFFWERRELARGMREGLATEREGEGSAVTGDWAVNRGRVRERSRGTEGDGSGVTWRSAELGDGGGSGWAAGLQRWGWSTMDACDEVGW